MSWLDPFLAGKTAYTITTDTFVQPAVNALVTIPVKTGAWMVPGQVIFVGNGGGAHTGGYYSVDSFVDTLHVRARNLGYSANATPGQVISAGAGVTAGGTQGADGASGGTSYSTTTLNFTQPAVSGTVSVTIGSTAWMATGEPVYVAGGGAYTVSSITDSTHAVLLNTGASGNASPGSTVTAGAAITPSGVAGANGTNGTNGSNGVNAYTTTSANFTQPAVSSTVSVQVVDTSWMVAGQTLFIGDSGGYYTVSSITNATHVVVSNTGDTPNASPGTTIHSGAGVSPGGVQGSGGGGGGGMTENIAQTAHGFSVGQAIYFNGSAWALAEANAGTTLGVGIVTVVIDANNFTVCYGGPVTGLSGLTAGQYYFVSDATPGALTATEPVAASSFSNPLLIAKSSTTGVVLPFRPQGNMATSGQPDIVQTATVAALEGTSSTGYTDLSTVGPQVTLTTGTTALVVFTADVYKSSFGNSAFTSVAVSGATTIAAADICQVSSVGNQMIDAAHVGLITGLTPGVNTFTMKYRVDGSSFQWQNRSLLVFNYPFASLGAAFPTTFSAEMSTASDVTLASWSSVTDLVSVTVSGATTYLIRGVVVGEVGGATTVSLRLRDDTAGSDLKSVYGTTVASSGNTFNETIEYLYTAPSTAARVIKLQAGRGSNSAFVKANSDSREGATLTVIPVRT